MPYLTGVEKDERRSQKTSPPQGKRNDPHEEDRKNKNLLNGNKNEVYKDLQEPT